MARGEPQFPYEEAFAQQAKVICKLGGTDADLAEFFNVSGGVINHWRWTQPAFARAMALGKREADDRVEQSLYSRAVGYSHNSEKIMTQSIGNGMSEVVRVPIIEHYPPEVRACEFWLTNRRPDKWKHKRETEQLANVTIRVEGGLPEPGDVVDLPASEVREIEGGGGDQ